MQPLPRADIVDAGTWTDSVPTVTHRVSLCYSPRVHSCDDNASSIARGSSHDALHARVTSWLPCANKVTILASLFHSLLYACAMRITYTAHTLSSHLLTRLRTGGSITLHKLPPSLSQCAQGHSKTLDSGHGGLNHPQPHQGLLDVVCFLL
jgi:hypothetical protein